MDTKATDTKAPNTKARTALGAVIILIALVLAAGYAAYFIWNGRGDRVEFSAAGGLGWGSRTLTTDAGKLGTLPVGTARSFLFVRDTQYDQKTQSLLANSGPTGAVGSGRVKSPAPRKGK